MPPTELSEATDEALPQPPEVAASAASDEELLAPDVEGEENQQAEVVDAVVAYRQETLHHWLLLIGAVVVVALSAALDVRPEGKVAVPGMEKPLPGICSFRRWSGHPCPGCGLTRSFISIAHGDLAAAWHFNPTGILLFLVLASQIPYRAIQIWRIRTGRSELQWARLAFYLTWVVVITMVLQWIVRLLLQLLG